MAMSREEYLRYSEDNIAMGLKAAKKHLASGKALGAIKVNLFTAFSWLVERGLIQWRHNLGSPVGSFRSAIDVAHQAVHALPAAVAQIEALQRNAQRTPQWDPSPLRKLGLFPFGFATLVSMLLDGKPDPALLRVMPKPIDWRHGAKKNDGDIWVHFLDSGVVLALIAGSPPEAWEDVLAFGRKSKRLTLAVDSYELYMKLIDAALARDEQRMTTLISESKRLYRKRKRNSYFAGGVEYLGRDGGEESVDLIVSLILKWHSIGKASGVKGPAEYDYWRW